MEPVTLRLAHVVNENDGFHIAAVRFEELVEERTGGAVQVAIYPNATLGDERTLLEGMQIGTIDMGVITNGPAATLLPEIAVFELPSLFPSAEAACEVLDGEIGQELLDRLPEVGLRGLACAERGFRNLTKQRAPGGVARGPAGPAHHGQENPVNVIHSFDLAEAQAHMTLSRHTYSPAIFVMSQAVWQGLPEAAQAVVVEAAREAAGHERQVNAEMEEAQLDERRAEAGIESSVESATATTTPSPRP